MMLQFSCYSKRMKLSHKFSESIWSGGCTTQFVHQTATKLNFQHRSNFTAISFHWTVIMKLICGVNAVPTNIYEL